MKRDKQNPQGEEADESQDKSRKPLPVRLRPAGGAVPWQAVFAVVVLVWAVLTALPNALSQEGRDGLPSWLPHRAVSLGLDLSGGSHLLLEADFAPVFAETFESLLVGYAPCPARVRA